MNRLLFITEHFSPALGGIAASANRIVAALCALSIEVDVIAWTRALQPGVVESTGENPRVFRVGRYLEWDNTFPHTMNLCAWLYAAAPYDRIWGHYLNGGDQGIRAIHRTALASKVRSPAVAGRTVPERHRR